jgi:hypothetical protein
MFTIQKLRYFVHKMYLCVPYQCHKKSVIFLHRRSVLGEFVKKIRKAMLPSLRLSARSSYRQSNGKKSAPTGQNFMKFNIEYFLFRKAVETIQITLKSDKNNGVLYTWRRM